MSKSTIRFFVFVFFLNFLSSRINAQLSGTLTVPGTYTSLAAAINDLNTLGVSGPVVVDVAAGYTETAPVGGYSLMTIAGASTVNTVTFQKSGAGANPLISAYTGTATPTSAAQDGVWRFIGADYITVDGIDITDPNSSNPATMEFGYGFFKASTTDGCQYNTIKNCVITLNRINNVAGFLPAFDGSRGIELVNALSGSHTANVFVSSAAGSNSYNKLYSNTIQNCNTGIALSGYSTLSLGDMGNDVGGSSSSTGNTIVNYGGGGAAAAAVAIRTLYQFNVNISYNTIDNNNGSGVNHATTLRGIQNGTASSATVSITNNTVTLKSGSASTSYIIENVAGSLAASNAVNITNNLITNCTFTVGTAGTYYGIYNTASPATLNINSNSFVNNTTNATTASNYLIYNSGNAASQNINNNNLSFRRSNTTAYSGALYSIYNLGGNTTNTLSISGNTFSNYDFLGVAASGSLYFIYQGGTAGVANINGNNWNGLNLNHTGGIYMMYHTSPTQNLLSVSSNTVMNVNRTAAANGYIYGYYSFGSSPGTSNHTLANNIFSNITATVTGTGGFYGMYISDGSASPYPKKSIYNNIVSNITYSASGTMYGYYMNYLGDGTTSSGSSIYNNTLSNISFGGFLYGFYPSSTGSPSQLASVYSNTISDINGYGAGYSVYGAYMGSGGAGINFYKNKIYNITQTSTSGTAYGAYVWAATTFNLYNNLIGNINAPASSNLTGVSGIYISGGSNVNLHYNSVYLNATSTGASFGSAALYASTTPTLTLRNNIFYNNSTPNGGGVTSAYRRSSTILTSFQNASDNNLYYAGTPSANRVIFYDGTGYQTLAAYKALVSPRDGGAVTENPPFVSTIGSNANFLDISTSVPTQVESAAAPVAGITDDYIGTLRNTATPDIGAWEGNFMPNDITAPAIANIGFTNSSCGLTTRTMTVTITDASGVATGTLAPRVYYKVNAGAYTSVQGTLSSGTVNNGVWTFVLTYAGVNNDVISYYVTAQDVASTPNVGANPSGGFSATDVNTIITNPTTPYAYTIGSLNGSYTVGAGGNFLTLTAAANAYNTMCISGPVTFVLTDPAYSSTTGEVFPIVFKNTVYASSTNSLLIVPNTGVSATVVGTGTTSVIKFLNAKYITMDGLNTGGSALTFSTSYTFQQATIWLASNNAVGSGNGFIGLKNLNIFGGSSTSVNFGIYSGLDGTTPFTSSMGMNNDDITIQGNNIEQAYYGIYAYGQTASSAGGLDNWTVTSNTVGPVTAGVNNIRYTGMYFAYMVNLNVSSNLVRNVVSTSTSHGGIYLGFNITGGAVTQNTVNNVSSSGTGNGTSSTTGIFAGANVINMALRKNTIHTIYNTNPIGYGARGIMMSLSNTNANNIIENNMISDIFCYSGTTYFYWPVGIALENSSGGVFIDHNTVNLNSSHTGLSSATGAAAMLVNTASASGLRIRNNIFSNTYDNSSSSSDSNYGIYSNSSVTSYSVINYNDYDVSGATNNYLGYIAATPQANLAAMQASFGGNANSQTITAVFNSTVDAHLNPPWNGPLDNLGTPIAGITTDIDGQVRSGTTPDVGADEFTAPAGDAIPPQFTLIAPTTSACNLTTRTFTANVADGTGVATGSLSPRVYYTLNGGPYTSTQGTLTAGTFTNGVWTFVLTYAASIGDVVSYYFVGQDVVATPNVGSNPVAGFTAVDVNNVTTNPTTPYTYTVAATLAGTYTVGAGGTFTTLTQAANAYNIACLTGSVNYVLTNTSYSGSETFPILFLNNPSASSTNSLLINPASGVSATVTGSPAAPALVKFLNARYITIDGINSGGSNLTFDNINSSASADIWMASTAGTGPGNKFIGVKNATLIGGIYNATNFGIVAGVDGTTPSAVGGMDNDNITIEGNTILKNYYGIYSGGTSATSTGGLDGWNISNNIIGPVTSGIDNIGFAGIYGMNMLNVTISGNKVQNVTPTTVSNGGIYLQSNVNNAAVVQNTVTNILANSTASGISSNTGIFFGTNVINSSIRQNVISSVYNSSTGGWGARGIMLNTANGASNDVVENNMISDIFTYSDVSYIYWPVGIDIEGSTGGVNLDFNSVSLYGSHPSLTSACGAAAILMNTSGTNLRLRNNIFHNTYDNSNTTTDINYAIYSISGAANYAAIDYNNYYVGGSAANLVLGYIASTNQTNLAAIQASFGGNANSQNVNTVFTAPTDLHLLPSANVAFDNLGSPIAGITLDVDNQTRSTTTPDIGADEFTGVLLPTDAGLTLLNSPSSTGCYSANENVVVTIKNYGSLSLTNIPVTVYMTGPLSQTLNATYPGTLTSMSTIMFTVGVVNMSAPGSYTFSGFTSMPGDGNTLNDAITIETKTVTPNVSIMSPLTVCSGASATLTAGGSAVSYTWSTGANTASIVVSPSVTTIYTLTGSSAGSCTAAVVSTLTVNNPTITGTGTMVCNSGTGPLSTTAFAPVSWYATPTSTTVLANGNIYTPPSAITTTTYYAEANSLATGTLLTTLAGGNSQSGNMFDVTAVSNIVIDGFDMNLITTGTTAVEVWYRTGSFVGFEASSTGWTQVLTTTVTGMGSGMITPVPSTLNITVPAGQTYAFYVTSATAGSNVNYTNGTTLGALYSSNADLQFFEGKGVAYPFAGSFTPRIWNGVIRYKKPGCTSPRIPVTLTVTPSPTMALSASSSTVCSGGTATLTANGATSYTWSTGANTSAIVETPTVTTNYTVTGENAGCFSSDTISLFMAPAPSVTTAASSPSLCSGTSVTLTASGASTYSWSTGANTASTVESPTVNTTYTVTGDIAGCTGTGTIALSVITTPTVTASTTSSVLCTGASATLTANGATTYSWSTGALTAIIVETPSVTTSYSVTGDNMGCTGMDMFTLTVNPTPTVTTSASSSSLCSGQTATLTATGATTYSWSSGAMTASTAESPGTTTTYTVTGDALGCTSSDTLTLFVTSTPTVIGVASPNTLCPGESTTLTAIGAPSYTWSSGAMTASTVETPTATTVYTVSGDNSGCVGMTTVPVTVAPGVTVSVTQTPTLLCSGNSATLIASGAGSYTWSTGANAVGIIVSPTITTNYTVTGDNGGSCTGTAVITQSVGICSGLQALGINSEIELYPNPTQSMLHIVVPDVSKETQFELYDAIGRLVMSMELKENHTTLNVIELPGGVYTYRIRSGETMYKQGKLVRD